MSNGHAQQAWASARAAARRGDLQLAGRHYLAAAKRDKKNTLLFLEAGINAAEAGDMAQARKFLEHAKKLAPQNPDVHFNLGHAALVENLPEAALAAFEETQRFDPKYPGLKYSLALVHFRLGDARTSQALASDAVREDSTDTDAWLLKAQAEAALNLREQAVASLQALLDRDPGHLDARLLIAEQLARLFLSYEVERHLAPVATHPDLPAAALIKVGDIYGMSGFPEKAAAIAEKALAKAPTSASAHALYASTQIDIGGFDIAERHFRKAIALDAGHALSYQGLADIKRLTEGDRKPLETLYNSPETGDQARMQCGFALYFLDNKAGRHDEAFAALTTANDIMKAHEPHDVEQTQRHLLRVCNIITDGFLREHTDEGYPGTGAIFIIGMPRSGTTLAEQLLAASPAVLAGGERTDIIALRRSIANYPDGVSDLKGSWAEQAGRRVHQAMFAEAQGHTHATDKLPGNYSSAGLIKWVLPNARFVYCHRSPQANALSLFEQHFSALPFSRDLKDIAVAYNAHLRFIRHWRESCHIDMFDLDYDALVKDPEPIAKALYAHVGLDWQPEYLDITKVDRSISTASRWQVRQPINTKSVERWRHYEGHLRPFTDALETG